MVAGGCVEAPASPVSAVGRVVAKAAAVNPPSDDARRPWELVWALTEQTYNERELFLTVHRRPNALSLEHPAMAGYDPEYRADVYAQVDGGYRLLRTLVGQQGYFLRPNYFRAFYADSPGREQDYFLQITEVYYGTGALVEEHIFKLRPDQTLDEVLFTPAPELYKDKLLPGEWVAKGEWNEFTNQGLFFHFAIWGPQDGNCCPTAGQVEGTYKIERRSPDEPYRMTVDTFKRGTLPADE